LTCTPEIYYALILYTLLCNFSNLYKFKQIHIPQQLHFIFKSENFIIFLLIFSLEVEAAVGCLAAVEVADC